MEQPDSIERRAANRQIADRVIQLAEGWGVELATLRPIILGVAREQARQVTGWHWSAFERALWKEIPLRAVQRTARILGTLRADPESFEALCSIHAPTVMVSAREVACIGGEAWAERIEREACARYVRWVEVVVARDVRRRALGVAA